MKALAILRCLYGSKIVLLAMVIGTCEIHSRDISQENYHACNTTHNQTSICGLRNIIGTYLSIQNNRYSEN